MEENCFWWVLLWDCFVVDSVFFLHVVASVLAGGKVVQCLIWFEVVFLFIWWFFFNDLMKYNHGFFCVRFSVSCFFKKRKVFFLLISKKGFCWMNWIVCRLSCRRICFFSDSNFFFNGIKKNFIVWKKFFYMCPFFIHRNHGWKKKVDKINEFEKKRNDVYLQMVMIFSIHFFLFFRRSWQLFQKWVRFFSEIVIV